MQFKVPKTYKDLTLGELVVLNTETDPVKRVAKCSNMSVAQLREFSAKDITEADAHLMKIKEKEFGTHFKILEIDGNEYGFIPDWDAFSLGEWMDMEGHCKNFWKNATKIVSLLYRPIDRKQGDIYTIKKYTAKEDSKPFENMKATDFAGMMVFFSITRKKLLNTIQLSLLTEAKNQVNLAKDGAGIPCSIPLQERTYSKWTKLAKFLQGLFSRTLHTSKI